LSDPEESEEPEEIEESEEWKEWEKKKQQDRQNCALKYEHVLRHLWGNRPDAFDNWMNMDEPRGGADGYAEADIWRLALEDGDIADVDVGFVKALEAVAHQLAYMRDRIETLERRLDQVED
jgi:hypothetical protein